MSDDALTEVASQLAPVAKRHPEKTFHLGQVFNDTTNSYKLLWFLAILQLLRRCPAPALTVTDILTEMAVVAWHPVCLYRLSLGRQDKFQEVMIEIRKESHLAPTEEPTAVRQFFATSPIARTSLVGFSRYVPQRFLTPWFAEKLRGETDSKRDRLIVELARQSQQTSSPCPYWFDSDNIQLNQSWTTFLTENMAVVRAFAEHHLALYLQARNPNVPGVVNKLRAPTRRQLNPARSFWNTVRANLVADGHPDSFQDIYSQQSLGESFAIDHFLPWSFVAHDLAWNLTPVEQITNSSKADLLPKLDVYLPRLAKLHLAAIGVAKIQPRILQDYVDCFKLDPDGLSALNLETLTEKYREVIVPQEQIARSQGFQTDWIFRS